MLTSRFRLAAKGLVRGFHSGTYESTIRNLRINDQTRVIYQGAFHSLPLTEWTKLINYSFLQASQAA